MEKERSQSWTLIAIAGLGLVLSVIALVVAFNAKSASDDAATQQSVDEVSTELSNLVDRLGIAAASLTGEQAELQGKAKQAAQESRNAVTNLSNRLDKLERQTAKLKASAKQTTKLTKEVGSLETETLPPAKMAGLLGEEASEDPLMPVAKQGRRELETRLSDNSGKRQQESRHRIRLSGPRSRQR